MLNLLLQHGIASMPKADEENMSDKITEEMKEKDRVGAVIKSKIIGCHVKNYFIDYKNHMM